LHALVQVNTLREKAIKMSHIVTGDNAALKAKIKISPSAKAIFYLLNEQKSPLSVKDIVKELPYSERTIQYGLRQLRKYHLVEKRPNLQDLRESLYLISSRSIFLRFIKL
jgi:DNA-binding MarR family transcriptional regulator